MGPFGPARGPPASASMAADQMIELRIHGRGGQGAVVASKVLAEAAFLRGRYVQSYPDYGVERRGAPVVAFARIAEPGDDFFVRQDIREPDHLLVLDATPARLGPGAVRARSRGAGWWSTPRQAPAPWGCPRSYRVATVDAAGIAVRHGLGSRSQPVVNTAILGAFVRATGVVELEALLEAIDLEVPVKAEENRAAASRGLRRRRIWDNEAMSDLTHVDDYPEIPVSLRGQPGGAAHRGVAQHAAGAHRSGGPPARTPARRRCPCPATCTC